MLLSTDLALGRPTTASSINSGLSTYAAGNATDGNSSTRWASASEAGAHSSIYVDLGSVFDIDRVHLKWEASYASSYKVQTSTVGGSNDANWTDVYSTATNASLDNDVSLSGAGRYVRVNCFAGPNTLYSLYDFQVYGPEDIARGKPASASSINSGSSTYAASNVTDGNPATRWASNSESGARSWVLVDLGQPYDVSRVKPQWEYSRPSQFRVQTADYAWDVLSDQSNWRDVATVTDNQMSHDLAIPASAPSVGRYVRVLCEASTVNTLYSLYDIQVYGTPSLALNTTATASSVHAAGGGATFVAANATDENLATRWASAQQADGQAWIYADLGADKDLRTVRIWWEASYASQFDVKLANGGADLSSTSSWRTAAHVTGNTSTNSDVSINDRARYVRVECLASTVNTVYSIWELEAFAPAVPVPRAPAAPGGLTATAHSSTEVDVAWQDVTGEWGYRVERRPHAGGAWSAVTTLADNATSFRDSGLTPVTQYDYRVFATNAAGDSPDGQTATATTALAPPLAAGNVAASPNQDGTVLLTWSDNSDNETGFKIEQSIAGGTYAEIHTSPANTTSYLVGGLNESTSYLFRVTAQNGAGSASPPAPAGASTPTLFGPGGFGASLSPDYTQITLSWDDNSKNDRGFGMQVIVDGQDWPDDSDPVADYDGVADIPGGLGRQTGVFPKPSSGYSLAAGTTYQFRMRTVSMLNELSAWAMAGAVYVPPVAAPSTLVATAVSQTGMTLWWTNNATEQVSFRVEKSTDGVHFTDIGGTTATTLTVTQLTPGTKYWFRVKATNARGSSAFAAAIEQATLPTIALNVQGVADPAGGGFVLINENYDEQNRDAAGNLVRDNQGDGPAGAHRIIDGDPEVLAATLNVTAAADAPTGWKLLFDEQVVKVWWRPTDDTWMRLEPGALHDLTGPAQIDLRIEGLAVSSVANSGAVQAKVFTRPIPTDAQPAHSNEANLTVVRVKVRPEDDDFAPGFAGRIVINSRPEFEEGRNSPETGYRYYTTEKTTTLDTPAQTENDKFRATVQFPGMDPHVISGSTVYFRLTDPDDRSPWETDSTGNDNLLPIGDDFIPESGVVGTYQVNGEEMAAAEAVVEVGMVSGDNFVVEASFDPNFTSIAGRSTVLVAWRRVYLEVDMMYKRGATIITPFVPDYDLNPDVIDVDSTADFQDGDQVVLFTPTVGVLRTVITTTATSITVEDLDVSFEKYSGVKLAADSALDPADLLPVPYRDLPTTFGLDTYGTDGGTFTEFVPFILGSDAIPKYAAPPTLRACRDLALHWFANAGVLHEVIQLASFWGHQEQRIDDLGHPFFADGVTYSADNVSILFLGRLRFTPPKYHGLEEIQAHELGHQFPGVDALPWTDTHTYLPNYTGSGNDIMTYNATEFDVKFFEDTIKTIRMALLEVA